MTGDQHLLDAVSEAGLLGTSQASVSRARSQHPSHPANGPRAVHQRIGKRVHILAPRGEVLAWWPPAGSRLSPAQWQYLRSLAAEEPDAAGLGTPRVVSTLRARGLLDEAGRLTDPAQALLTPVPADQA